MISCQGTRLLAALALALASTTHAQAEKPQNLEIRKVETVYLDDVLAAPEDERRVELFLRAETRNGEPVEYGQPLFKVDTSG